MNVTSGVKRQRAASSETERIEREGCLESVKWNGNEKCSKGLGGLDTNSPPPRLPLLCAETGAGSESHADQNNRIHVLHVKLDTYQAELMGSQNSSRRYSDPRET